MPHSQGPSNNSYPEPNFQISCPFFFAMVVPNYLSGSEALCDVSEHLCFYSVQLASRQTPKLEDHSWSAVHDYLFNIFAANVHIWRHSPPSATQRTRNAVVTGTHEWQQIKYLLCLAQLLGTCRSVFHHAARYNVKIYWF